MSFVETLGNRLIRYLDKQTRDPEAEAEEKLNNKNIKAIQKKANKLINDEKALIKKAMVTPFTGTDNTTMVNYSIFPEDALELNTFLNEIHTEVNNATTSGITSEELDTHISDSFNEAYENFKIKAIYNNQVYVKSGKFTKRFETWITYRAIKQAIHDNPNASKTDIEYLNKYKEILIKFLKDTKHTKPDDDKDTAILNDYENILKTYNGKKFAVGNTVTDQVTFNKALSNVFLMIGNAKEKIKRNHYEVDFNDVEGDAFTGNVTEESVNKIQEQIERDQDEFSIESLIIDTLSWAITIFFFLFVVFILLMGASMAVNLNVHKSMPYRIFYMIYGFLFGLIVFAYVFIYKYWYLGIKPYYYGFMPIVSGFFVNPIIQSLFGWLTFRPDKKVLLLQEWRYFDKEITQ
jgi:hypothetical protein